MPAIENCTVISRPIYLLYVLWNIYFKVPCDANMYLFLNACMPPGLSTRGILVGVGLVRAGIFYTSHIHRTLYFLRGDIFHFTNATECWNHMLVTDIQLNVRTMAPKLGHIPFVFTTESFLHLLPNRLKKQDKNHARKLKSKQRYTAF